MQARKNFIKQMKNELIMSKFVAQMENLDFTIFLDEIESVIHEIKKEANHEQPHLASCIPDGSHGNR